MINSDIRINNLIASGKEFSDISTIGLVRSIGNDDVDFEQIEIECEDSFEWLFKDNYCGVPVKGCLLEHTGFNKHDALLTTLFEISISRFKSVYKVISISLALGNKYIGCEKEIQIKEKKMIL